MKALDEMLIAAHECDDRAALVGLYAQAAESVNDLDAACFFLTHAYVFALEAGDARASDLRAHLVAQGRET